MAEVWILTSGTGDDGDEMRIETVHATEEAGRAYLLEEYGEQAVKQLDNEYGSWQLERWEVLS